MVATASTMRRCVGESMQGGSEECWSHLTPVTVTQPFFVDCTAINQPLL
jgi:hypothetical protein